MSSSVSEKSQVLSTEFEPLLSDLTERKQSFRRNVICLASELKEVRGRLEFQEQSFATETLSRKEAEIKVRNMEKEILGLQRRLEEKNGELQASTSAAEKYLEEVEAFGTQIATTEASSAAAQSAQRQCLALAKELDAKNIYLKDQEDWINRLAEHLDNLQKDLQAREFSQKQLIEEVTRVEHEIMQALAKAGASKDSELRIILDELSPRNIKNINKLLAIKDEEIEAIRDEIRIMSAQWKPKARELESQLEKQRRVDQDLKKRVMKLEFCLQESRAQTRKLQRTAERRDKALKELKAELARTPQKTSSMDNGRQNFWESSSFKIVVSMSMLVLVILSKR